MWFRLCFISLMILSLQSQAGRLERAVITFNINYSVPTHAVSGVSSIEFQINGNNLIETPYCNLERGQVNRTVDVLLNVNEPMIIKYAAVSSYGRFVVHDQYTGDTATAAHLSPWGEAPIKTISITPPLNQLPEHLVLQCRMVDGDFTCDWNIQESRFRSIIKLPSLRNLLLQRVAQRDFSWSDLEKLPSELIDDLAAIKPFGARQFLRGIAKGAINRIDNLQLFPGTFLLYRNIDGRVMLLYRLSANSSEVTYTPLDTGTVIDPRVPAQMVHNANEADARIRTAAPGTLFYWPSQTQVGWYSFMMKAPNDEIKGPLRVNPAELGIAAKNELELQCYQREHMRAPAAVPPLCRWGGDDTF